MSFTGIPAAAVDFYRALEQDNSREWWSAHKTDYDTLVKQPMLALAAELEPVFGEAKVFRPNRDVRFSADKSPYKTHQGLFVPTMSFGGFYAQLDAHGLMMGAGNYHMASDQLARYRAAVANDVIGPQLEESVGELVAAGYVLDGDLLATRPRGVAPDAPRLELLRHKTLSLALHVGVPEWLSTPDAAGWISDAWDECRPLLEWFGHHVGDTERPRR